MHYISKLRSASRSCIGKDTGANYLAMHIHSGFKATQIQEEFSERVLQYNLLNQHFTLTIASLAYCAKWFKS